MLQQPGAGNVGAAIATLATEAPGASHSATICAFCCSPSHRRLIPLSLAIVSTSKLHGHDPSGADGSNQDGLAGRIRRSTVTSTASVTATETDPV
jgi:hypothetical protein